MTNTLHFSRRKSIKSLGFFFQSRFKEPKAITKRPLLSQRERMPLQACFFLPKPLFPWKCNYKKGIHVELVYYLYFAVYLYISFSNIEETERISLMTSTECIFLSFNNPSLSTYKVSVVKASSISAKASPALIAESSRVGIHVVRLDIMDGPTVIEISSFKPVVWNFLREVVVVM